MQSLCDQLLAAAGLALHQHRERGVGELLDQGAQGRHAGARAEQQLAGPSRRREFVTFRVEQQQLMFEPRAQQGGLAGLGHEVDRAQGQRVLDIAALVLARQHQHLHGRIEGEQFADQGKAFARPMRFGRQTEIDQRQLRRRRGLAQQCARLGAIGGRQDFELVTQHQAERIDNQLVVIDQQQQRARW